MPAGLKIYNDTGIIQIDDNYQNLFVVRSGTIWTDNNRMADLWIDWNGPIMVATSSPNGSSCAVQGRQGTNWIYKVGSRVPNDEVKWYAFSDPQNIPFQCGLRLCREDNSISFDSNQRPLVMSYMFTVDTPLLPQFNGREVDNLPKSNEIAYPQDIYIPLKQGHTYTAFPVEFLGAVSVVYRAKITQGGSSGNIPWYEHYCYMPQTWNSGVNFKAIKESEGGRDPRVPLFYLPKGRPFNNVQKYWVIDITGY